VRSAGVALAFNDLVGGIGTEPDQRGPQQRQRGLYERACVERMIVSEVEPYACDHGHQGGNARFA